MKRLNRICQAVWVAAVAFNKALFFEVKMKAAGKWKIKGFSGNLRTNGV